MSQHVSPRSQVDIESSASAFDSQQPSHRSYPSRSFPLTHTQSAESNSSSSSSTNSTPRSSEGDADDDNEPPSSSHSSTSASSSTSKYHLPSFAYSSAASRRSSSFVSEYSQRIRHTLTLAPRRRSSIPLVRVVRRKSTQLVMAGAILFFTILIVVEVRSHETRRALWDKRYALDEWDIRHSGDREVNLGPLRTDHRIRREKEILDRRSEADAAEGVRRSGDVVELLPPEEEELRMEVANKWPSWWGNVDVVGPSPYDHIPGPLPAGTEKRRMMFLTDYNDYLERMNTHTYEIVDAALRHPHLIVDVWGPGWAGYDRSIPLSANIRKRAHRIAQLESSKADFEKIQREQADEKEKERKWREKREWLSRTFEVTRAPVRGDEVVMGEEEEERWARPEWNEEVPEECSEVRFDVVLTISNIYKEDDPHVDALDCDALLVQQLGDCHEYRCTYEWYPHANNITLSKYAFELLELFSYDKVKAKYPRWEMGLFGHSPDTGNEWDFYPVPWANKTADAKIFGFDGSFYPIRTTVTSALNYYEENPHLAADSGMIITRHQHPGYFVWAPAEAHESPLETYELGHEYYQTHLKLREDFAKGMRETKICVFDSSLERKMIRKYAQAFLSGCVVAADIPTEQEEALSKFVIPLKTTWKIEQINEALKYYLDRPEVLQQMAMDGLVYARQHLTTTNKISHIMEMADHYRQGSRGYEFPYGFSMRCRSYWNDDDSYRMPWCPPGSLRGLEE
ncbi:hypothetical protein CI109_104739 [Kwoniella shandongensis]|uniref:Uncharacterized protein n=1 Tax=Kwoniella shandongensis TaxID=1734106 RepID=A0A5M6BRE8_9TREE|nr:uncharacterized protein CI109_006949 [Kwoniella shandongensis]KAA5524691.1 hypothetical protein CI109_006949 [Kwoniella shandongensis]